MPSAQSVQQESERFKISAKLQIEISESTQYVQSHEEGLIDNTDRLKIELTQINFPPHLRDLGEKFKKDLLQYCNGLI